MKRRIKTENAYFMYDRPYEQTARAFITGIKEYMAASVRAVMKREERYSMPRRGDRVPFTNAVSTNINSPAAPPVKIFPVRSGRIREIHRSLRRNLTPRCEAG